MGECCVDTYGERNELASAELQGSCFKLTSILGLDLSALVSSSRSVVNSYGVAYYVGSLCRKIHLQPLIIGDDSAIESCDQRKVGCYPTGRCN